VPVDENWVPLREAWDRALYAGKGFYRRSLPRDHFRTSVHASPLFAEALLTLARRIGVSRVVDVGAGGGELLAQLHALDGDIELMAVELRPRPTGLPDAIDWRVELPATLEGLVVANEVVDNVACDIVEVDQRGVVRLVEVDLVSSAERLGDVAPAEAVEWLSRWWPLDRAGERAEVGLRRDDWWAAITERVRSGACLAIDYGHVLAARPPSGSLASYREGRSVPVGFGGDRDITADVAFDSMQDRVGGTLRRQSQWLADLGIAASRPPLSLASTDPAGYVRELSRTGEVAELIASPGLGDFLWLVSLAVES
jgi:SAM-dependent MidA family methyltransferase